MLFKTVLSRKNPILKIFSCKLVWISIFTNKKNVYQKKSRNDLKKAISENGLKVYKILMEHESSIFFIIWSVLSVVDLVSTKECKSFKKSKKIAIQVLIFWKQYFFRPITLMEPKKSIFWDDDFFYFSIYRYDIKQHFLLRKTLLF